MNLRKFICLALEVWADSSDIAEVAKFYESDIASRTDERV